MTYRVFLRLGEGDSNQLLGSPAAARLGDNRAFFRHEAWAMGQIEKFKPYAPPDAAAVATLTAGVRRKWEAR